MLEKRELTIVVLGLLLILAGIALLAMSYLQQQAGTPAAEPPGGGTNIHAGRPAAPEAPAEGLQEAYYGEKTPPLGGAPANVSVKEVTQSY
jgi:hypothetical protein